MTKTQRGYRWRKNRLLEITKIYKIGNNRINSFRWGACNRGQSPKYTKSQTAWKWKVSDEEGADNWIDFTGTQKAFNIERYRHRRAESVWQKKNCSMSIRGTFKAVHNMLVVLRYQRASSIFLYIYYISWFSLISWIIHFSDFIRRIIWPMLWITVYFLRILRWKELNDKFLIWAIFLHEIIWQIQFLIS